MSDKLKGIHSDGGSGSVVVLSTEGGGATGIKIDSGLPVEVVGVLTATGGIALGSGGLARTGVKRILNARAKVGSAAGWVLGGADNLAVLATMAQSQTAGTLVVPVHGLRVGDTITAFGISAQIESAGGAVTIDAALRKLINVAADPTDNAVSTITQVSVTADTASQAEKTGLSSVVAATDSYYILITATTAASTDIQLLSANVTVTEA